MRLLHMDAFFVVLVVCAFSSFLANCTCEHVSLNSRPLLALVGTPTEAMYLSPIILELKRHHIDGGIRIGVPLSSKPRVEYVLAVCTSVHFFSLTFSCSNLVFLQLIPLLYWEAEILRV
jgi:hypothetical protein